MVRNPLSKKIANKYIPTTGGLPTRKNKKKINIYIYHGFVDHVCCDIALVPLYWSCR